MDTFIIYKGIKSRLNTVAPGFYYLGQYAKGKDNTSYKVPAIYIEMPANLKIDFFPRKVQVAKDAQVKIHLITNAPFKNHDNSVQDSAIAEHQNKLNSIDDLMNGWHLVDGNDELLTQQFISINASIGNFTGVNLVSVLTFKTEFYSRPIIIL